MSIRLPAAAVRPLLRVLGDVAFDPTSPWTRQRRILDVVGATTRTGAGVSRRTRKLGGVDCEEIRARAATGDRVVVHAHGGGYTTGGPALLRAWAAAVARATDATVILPDYRLAPEHPAPAAPRDMRAVWDDLASTVAPSSIVVSGDSAGGGLALGLAQALVAEDGAGPAGLILISPWLDLTVDRHHPEDLAARDVLLDPGWLARCVDAYAADRNPADPLVSPLFGPLGGLPPVLVQAATDDVLVSDADRFVTGARAAGTSVVYTRASGLWHDFPLQTGLVAAADRAAAQAADFVNTRLARSPGGTP